MVKMKRYRLEISENCFDKEVLIDNVNLSKYEDEDERKNLTKESIKARKKLISIVEKIVLSEDTSTSVLFDLVFLNII